VHLALGKTAPPRLVPLLPVAVLLHARLRQTAVRLLVRRWIAVLHLAQHSPEHKSRMEAVTSSASIATSEEAL